jgi:hypothetical protein
MAKRKNNPQAENNGRPDTGRDLSEVSDANPPREPPRPRIEPEEDEKIDVGAIGKLTVPREDVLADLDDGTEVELVNEPAAVLRKPDPEEWFALNLPSELPIKLLVRKLSNGRFPKDEYYYVVKELRAHIPRGLKHVRVFQCYSLTTRSEFLWPVKVTPNNSWYDSIAPLFGQPTDFFEANKIKVYADEVNPRYRVRVNPLVLQVSWSSTPIEDLLGDALGPKRFINSTKHPMYRELTEGKELE